jgi:hypothetical protein
MANVAMNDHRAMTAIERHSQATVPPDSPLSTHTLTSRHDLTRHQFPG